MNSALSAKTFETWKYYYHHRQDDKHDEGWQLNYINHPIQTDNYNCGVFVINFIKRFILFSSITFDPTNCFLETERTIIAQTIEDNCDNV